jgi:hypothetical protein
MNNNDVLNGILLLVLVSWAAFGDGYLFEMIYVNTLAIFFIGLFFLVDGLVDERGKEIKSIKKKLSLIEGLLDSNLDELTKMVLKTQNILDYKFRMFVEICMIQFENLTQEWQNHFMMSAEFSSLYEKASKNPGLLTAEEKKEFTQWMNKALESLEGNMIREYLFSEDFTIYKEIIELYND